MVSTPRQVLREEERGFAPFLLFFPIACVKEVGWVKTNQINNKCSHPFIF